MKTSETRIYSVVPFWLKAQNVQGIATRLAALFPHPPTTCTSKSLCERGRGQGLPPGRMGDRKSSHCRPGLSFEGAVARSGPGSSFEVGAWRVVHAWFIIRGCTDARKLSVARRISCSQAAASQVYHSRWHRCAPLRIVQAWFIIRGCIGASGEANFSRAAYATRHRPPGPEMKPLPAT